MVRPKCIFEHWAPPTAKKKKSQNIKYLTLSAQESSEEERRKWDNELINYWCLIIKAFFKNSNYGKVTQTKSEAQFSWNPPTSFF
jgi:hypothetical protein